MAIRLIRSLVATLALTAVILPGTALAQAPSCPEPCDGGIRNVLWQEEPAVLGPYVLEEEAHRGPLRRFFCDGEWYFSWGYSREAWSRTNISVSQPSLGNNFTVYDVRGSDDGSITDPTAAQYNIRLGRFFGEQRLWAIEFNFDHTKYNTVSGQTAHVAGTINNRPVDGNYTLDSNFFDYKLHNGANHLMLNLVRRVPLLGEVNENFSVAAIGKFGVGIMLPHAENTILGNTVDVGPKSFNNLVGINRGWWQVNGFTTGFEAGFRIMLWNPIYLEITDKVAFATLDNVPVFQGTARQHNLWMNEVVLSVGITFGGGRSYSH